MRLPLLAALAAAALSACEDRRTFDERYRETSEKLEAKAEELDRNITANPQREEPAKR